MAKNGKNGDKNHPQNVFLQNLRQKSKTKKKGSYANKTKSTK